LRTSAGELTFSSPRSDRLATHQRDRLGMIRHPCDGEAEIGLAPLLHEVERNELVANEMREHHAKRRIADRADDQIAGE